MGPKKRVVNIPPVAPTPNQSSSQMKYRPFVDKGRWAAKGSKGTKPLPDPITVPEILTKVLVHGCKKVLFVDPKIRLTAYGILLFFASLVADYLPFPKTYFAYSSNVPNQYFVKFSWAWTFIFVGLFMFFTSSVYCCGDRKRVTRHFGRLLAGTLIWFLWTNFFRIIEESTGQCLIKDGSTLYSLKSRKSCVTKGGKWTSFDISGHAFLLVWCVFFITEEAKAILGWDGIKDFIRNEDHNRSKAGFTTSSADFVAETPLNALTEEEFEALKKTYTQYDFLAKGTLVIMTLLAILWDIMILATACYFHVMIEKVIAGLIAAFMWFCMYRGFYPLDVSLSPGLPGVGLFKYTETKSLSNKPTVPSGNKPSTSVPHIHTTRPRGKDPDDVPKFMGMPLYALRKNAKEAIDLDADIEGPVDNPGAKY